MHEMNIKRRTALKILSAVPLAGVAGTLAAQSVAKVKFVGAAAVVIGR